MSDSPTAAGYGDRLEEVTGPVLPGGQGSMRKTGRMRRSRRKEGALDFDLVVQKSEWRKNKIPTKN